MKNMKLGLFGAYIVSVLLMIVILTVPVIGIIYWVGEEINLLTIVTMLLIPSMVSAIFIAFTLHLKSIREKHLQEDDVQDTHWDGEEKQVEHIRDSEEK